MPSSLIFHTDPDSPYDVEIANVGVLGGNARGGIPIDRVAQRLHELQDDNGEPLTGAELRKAAEAWASARGLKTRSVKDLDEETLRVESGAFPAGPSIEEISRAASERDRAFYEVDQAPKVKADLPEREVDVHPQPLTAAEIEEQAKP